MTKRRAPLTIDNALTKIAAQIGWDGMAEVAGVAERTVRNWGDPGTDQVLPMPAAIKLDVAFRAGGGDGAPLYEVYSLLLENACAQRFADQAELARRTITAIGETADATQALVAVTMPGATPSDRTRAKREVEEGIAALTKTLPLLDEAAAAAEAVP